jgi:hypothetical protein
VFVGGVPPAAGEGDVFALFCALGSVSKIDMPRGKGCAFVQFRHRAEAEGVLARAAKAPSSDSEPGSVCRANTSPARSPGSARDTNAASRRAAGTHGPHTRAPPAPAPPHGDTSASGSDKTSAPTGAGSSSASAQPRPKQRRHSKASHRAHGTNGFSHGECGPEHSSHRRPPTAPYAPDIADQESHWDSCADTLGRRKALAAVRPDLCAPLGQALGAQRHANDKEASYVFMQSKKKTAMVHSAAPPAPSSSPSDKASWTKLPTLRTQPQKCVPLILQG